MRDIFAHYLGLVIRDVCEFVFLSCLEMDVVDLTVRNLNPLKSKHFISSYHVEIVIFTYDDRGDGGAIFIF